MIPSPPAKILIGIALEPEESKELLYWAIKTLVHPNDTIIALHVLVAESTKKHVDKRKKETKKWQSITKYQTEIRQAKAFVISVMGDFVKMCQSNQVNLEARVGFSSTVGKGLIEEAKTVSADFLLIGGARKQSNRFSSAITKYCLEHAPDGCSLILVGKCEQFQENFHSNFTHFEEKDIDSKIRRGKPSPTTVLDVSEGDSQSTEEDSSSFGESSTTKSPPLAPVFKGKSEFRKPIHPLKHISSFVRSALNFNGRKQNEDFLNQEKMQPLLRCFSYEEISNATNHFHPDNMVGQGGYSEVYRGNLEDGSTIAVKQLAKDNKNANKEKGFLIELGIIGHVNHPNTAILLGFCIDNGLYLIFEFYPNGTLSSALHGKTCESLAWPVRYRIAIGVASGLHYLHKCCRHRIIHRDIKASNVLLGPDYEPQISDFGLAKWLPNKWTHHAVIPIEGTFGYLAPEYFMYGIVDEKTDVFAFGVLLLEIVTGRRPVDSSKQNLLLWAKPLMESGNITELADWKLEGKYDMDQLHRVVLTASYCVRQSSVCRPSMNEVLELLTYGDDSKSARSCRIPKFTADEMDDYSMVFGYELPSNIFLDDIGSS